MKRSVCIFVVAVLFGDCIRPITKGVAAKESMRCNTFAWYRSLSSRWIVNRRAVFYTVSQIECHQAKPATTTAHTPCLHSVTKRTNDNEPTNRPPNSPQFIGFHFNFLVSDHCMKFIIYPLAIRWLQCKKNRPKKWMKKKRERNETKLVSILFECNITYTLRAVPNKQATYVPFCVSCVVNHHLKEYVVLLLLPFFYSLLRYLSLLFRTEK